MRRRRFITCGATFAALTLGARDRRVTSFYAGRILNGEKPADLPVQQAERIESVINTKAVKRLALRRRCLCWAPPTP
jgi:putative ABC transport system substrate-binding protein